MTDDKPITQETFHPVDGLVLLRPMSRPHRLPHIEVESVATIRGKVQGKPVMWTVTPTGARRLADALRRAAKIAERGYATAKELGAISGEDAT